MTANPFPARLLASLAVLTLLATPATASAATVPSLPAPSLPSVATDPTPSPSPAPDPAETDGLFFPVQLPLDAMDNTWGAARSGGRSHTGTDILAPHMAPVYAAASGEIMRAKGEDCADGQVCRDYYLALAGDDGRGYFYVHLNDDTPGRPNGCDGLGGVDNAFAPRLVEELERHGSLTGVRVEAGEHVGYNGSSGNADCGVDHVHFEIWDDHDWGATGKTNPYDELVDAIDAGNTLHRADDGPVWPGHPPVSAAAVRRPGGGLQL